MRNSPQIAFFIFCLCHSAFAADSARLRNGFSITHEKREILQGGTTTRLYLTTDKSSFVDVPSVSILSVEPIVPLPTIKSLAKTPATPVSSPPVEHLSEIVRDASDKNLVDENLIRSVIRQESGTNPRAISPKGARGLMQLMPATARNLGIADPFDARENVNGGVKYLRELMAQFDFDLAKALAAYNAGPESVVRFHGVPPYPETRAYVRKIIKEYNQKKLAARESKISRSNASTPSRVRPS